VRRPVDPAKFNGSVLVEWFNVTDNFDGEYFWGAGAAAHRARRLRVHSR
jgi:hypothetical protein